MPIDIEVSRQELARLFDVDARTVSEWQTLGLPYRKNGRSNAYNVPESIRWWAAWKYGAKDEETGKPIDLNRERARLAKEQADKQEMENEVRRGELLEASAVARAWADEASAAKAKLLSISGKVAPLVSVEDDAASCKGVIDDAVREALTELSDEVA